jgi:predicted aspartyl protease
MSFTGNGLRAIALGTLVVHSQILQAQLPAALVQPKPESQPGRESALEAPRDSYHYEKGEVLGDGHPHDTIPFRLDGGFLILVDGRIGSLSRLKFVLDTGATHTVIARRIQKRLSLPSHQEQTKVVNFDREVELPWTSLPELQLGPLVRKDIRVLVADLGQFSELAAGVDAIIGLDVLQNSESITIDYLKKLLTFKFSEFQHVDRGVPVALTVRIPTEGQSMRLIVDTGLKDFVLYQDRIANRLPQLKLRGNLEASAGRLKGQAATLRGLALGSDRGESRVLLLEGAPRSLPADIDGYLGMNALHAARIELDFASNTLRWQ